MALVELEEFARRVDTPAAWSLLAGFYKERGDAESAAAALENALERATGEGREVRVVGSGHSFTGAALSDGTLLRIEALDRLLDFDPASGLIRVEAGTIEADAERAEQQRFNAGPPRHRQEHADDRREDDQHDHLRLRQLVVITPFSVLQFDVCAHKTAL